MNGSVSLHWYETFIEYKLILAALIDSEQMLLSINLKHSCPHMESAKPFLRIFTCVCK